MSGRPGFKEQPYPFSRVTWANYFVLSLSFLVSKMGPFYLVADSGYMAPGFAVTYI